jgi:hypothetical protein
MCFRQDPPQGFQIFSVFSMIVLSYLAIKTSAYIAPRLTSKVAFTNVIPNSNIGLFVISTTSSEKIAAVSSFNVCHVFICWVMWLKTKFFGDLYSRIQQGKPIMCQVDIDPRQQNLCNILLDRYP